MDSTYYNALDGLSQEYRQIPMMLVKPSFFATNQYIYQD